MTILISKKLKKIVFALIVLIGVAVINSCNDDEVTKEEAAKTELEGTWSTVCTEDNDEGEIVYTIETEVYSDNSLSSTEVTYSDSGCTAKLRTFAITGTFSIGNSISGVEGAKELNLTVSTITITLHTDTEVTNANSVSFQGIVAWEKDTAESISEIVFDSNCDALSAGFVFYDIFKIDGNNLYFGDEGDGTVSCSGFSEATRPTVLETDYITKQ